MDAPPKPKRGEFPYTKEGAREYHRLYMRWYNFTYKDRAKAREKARNARTKSTTPRRKYKSSGPQGKVRFKRKRAESDIEAGYSIQAFMETPADRLPKVVSDIINGAALGFSR